MAIQGSSVTLNSNGDQVVDGPGAPNYNPSALPSIGTDTSTSSTTPTRQSTKGRNTGQDPAATLTGNPFTKDVYSYPWDIASLAHAMFFNINVPTVTLNSPGTNFTAAPNSQSRSQILRTGAIQGSASTINYSGTDFAQQLQSQGINLPTATLQQKTTRITTSIALYVPETLVFDERQLWETPSLLDVIGVGGLSAMNTDVQNFLSKAFGKGVGELVGTAGVAASVLNAGGVNSAINNTIKSVGGAVTATLGYAFNPLIEVIYSHPDLRNFQFDFLFAPRNSNEADQVWNIIYQFRYHSKPSYVNQGQGIGGAFFVPPSQFDITFLRQDENTGQFSENNNLPGIDTCILENVIVNEAPENMFVTNRDGMPTTIRMTLSFKELDMITKDRVQLGY